MHDPVRQHPEEKFKRAGLYGNPPCPICGGNWCGYNSFLCSCMREDKGSFKTVIQPKTDKPAYQHWLKPGTVNYSKSDELDMPIEVIASVEKLDRVYRELLNLLSLYQEHKEDLLRRGITEGDIKKNGYKSIPKIIKPWDICKKLKDIGYDLSGVPGFYKADGKYEGTYWTFSWKPGYFIPMLDAKGRIQALQRRIENPKEGEPKYMLLSSSGKKGGGNSGTPAHVARPAEIRDRIIWITEGPLKADIAAKYLGAVVIGLMSAGTWVQALEVVDELSPEEVITAYDMDFKTNKLVNKPLELLKGELKEKGLVVRQATWDEVKGIDDALVGGKKITIGGR